MAWMKITEVASKIKKSPQTVKRYLELDLLFHKKSGQGEKDAILCWFWQEGESPDSLGDVDLSYIKRLEEENQRYLKEIAKRDGQLDKAQEIASQAQKLQALAETRTQELERQTNLLESKVDDYQKMGLLGRLGHLFLPRVAQKN
jgi:hypothetical protein